MKDSERKVKATLAKIPYTGRVRGFIFCLTFLTFIGVSPTKEAYPASPTPGRVARAFTESLPVDSSHPFIWDNDTEDDAFALVFLMALAHTGRLKLIGISQSPHPYKRASENYQRLVNMARRSGWTNIPNATWDLGTYYMHALARPTSGEVEDTVPLDTLPARMMRDQVLAVGTRERPVVIGTGGALSTVASAYLLALHDGRGEEFAAKVVVIAGLGEGRGPDTLESYNESQDQWAVHVCLHALRVVMANYDHNDTQEPSNFFDVADSLPDTALGSYVKDQVATFSERYPEYRPNTVGDVAPILLLLFPTAGTYFKETRRVSFASWGGWPGWPHGPDSINWDAYRHVMHLQDDPASDDLMVYAYDRRIPNSFCAEAFRKAFEHGSDAVRPRN